MPVAPGESNDPDWSFRVSLASIVLQRVSIPSQTSMPPKVIKGAKSDMHNFSGRWCYSAAARHFALLGSGDDGGSRFFSVEQIENDGGSRYGFIFSSLVLCVRVGSAEVACSCNVFVGRFERGGYCSVDIRLWEMT